jgi:hypothetical protein
MNLPKYWKKVLKDHNMNFHGILRILKKNDFLSQFSQLHININKTKILTVMVSLVGTNLYYRSNVHKLRLSNLILLCVNVIPTEFSMVYHIGFKCKTSPRNCLIGPLLPWQNWRLPSRVKTFSINLGERWITCAEDLSFYIASHMGNLIHQTWSVNNILINLTLFFV